MSTSKLEQLKKQLNAEIQKTDSDSGLILSLSHEIASLDENNVRFSVDAGIINRLGKELVGRHETAVAELVKNAYDADAKVVNLYFENCWSPGGTLKIEDDGIGMTRDQLIRGFMTISSSDKIHNPKSVRYERTRAGQKGIGRFSTQRLGTKLTITTQTKQNAKALQVTIDWDSFAMDTNLLLVSNLIHEVEKTSEEGTVLFIENLRDGWSDAMLTRAYRYISDLLQPFPLSERFEESKDDPGFKASFYKDNVPVVNEENIFYQNATAEIEAYVDNGGDGFYSLKSSHFDVEDELFPIGSNKPKEDYEPFNSLKSVHLKAYYFIYNSGLIPKQTETAIKQNAEDYGGIRLYRNGFRVVPYAEKGNDWLRLDASVRRNVLLTPHGNNNFYGFIEVFDQEGMIFQELSSREGLLENDAFRELQDFAFKVLTDATIKISALRGKKTKTTQKNWEKKTKAVIEEVAAALEDAAKHGQSDSSSDQGSNNSQGGFSSEDFQGFAEKLRESAEQDEQERQQLLQEVQLLRILASLGLTIGEFVHEIKHHLRAFDLDIDFLHRKLSDEIYTRRTTRLKSNLNSFTTYTSYFDKAISENVNRKLEPVELKDAVRSFYNVIAPDAERSGIELQEPSLIGYELYTCPMHNSEWVSILFNFYTNSKKAIKRANAKGKVHIKVGEEKEIVYLEFSDNGDGIPSDKEDVIFDVFYTTSPPSGWDATEMEETSGTGLGLKIVRDIVSGYSGDVFVVPAADNYSTTIRVEIPKHDTSND